MKGTKGRRKGEAQKWRSRPRVVDRADVFLFVCALSDRHVSFLLRTHPPPHPPQASLEDIEEASNELMLADDEEIPFVVGECFLRVSQEEAEERLTAATEGDAKAVSKLEEEKKRIEERMDALKKVLYAHFGNAINLEE